MKTNFNPKNLVILAALAVFLLAPGMAHATCYVTAASALPYAVPAAGMSGAITISAPAGCRWNFNARGSNWVQILSAQSGSGSAVVYYRFLPNTTGRVRTASFGPMGLTATVATIPGRSAPPPSSDTSAGFTITLTQAAR